MPSTYDRARGRRGEEEGERERAGDSLPQPPIFIFSFGGRGHTNLTTPNIDPPTASNGAEGFSSTYSSSSW